MRDLFLLDPDVIFLNHGSFGACPVPVFDEYQRWQRELERQPVAFFRRAEGHLLDEARAELAAYLGTAADNVVFVTNATAGVNTVARSLDLQPGDEILGTDHEYGAVDYTWDYICGRTGAVYLRQPIPFPYTDDAAFVEALWRGVTPRTRVIAISHITSPTALTFPVAEVCRRAREAGILTIIDGAHAPGQIALNLDETGADFYTGNCHKWLCAPKGAGFLYARPEHHAWLYPLVVSWGCVPGKAFAARHQWQGTRDLSAYLAVPAAVNFQREHHWDAVRARCHTLAVQTRARIAALTGLPHITHPANFAQMFTVPLPPCDVMALKDRLYDEYRVELPGIVWQDRPFIRISFQGYNTPADADGLLHALEALLPEMAQV